MRIIMLAMLCALTSACATTGTTGAGRGAPPAWIHQPTTVVETGDTRMYVHTTVGDVDGGQWSDAADFAKSQCRMDATLLFARHLCEQQVSTTVVGDTTTRKVNMTCSISGVRTEKHYLYGSTMHCLHSKALE